MESNTSVTYPASAGKIKCSMATRRMFARSIVQSDAFTDMPMSAQLLYFYFGLEADDDGIVSNHRRLMRASNFNADDLQILIAKGFVIWFESENVLVIKHWRINNELKNDRYKPSTFYKVTESLKVAANKAYSLDTGTPLSLFNTDVSTVDTQYRIGKVSIGKDKEDHMKSFETFWKSYPRKVAKQKCQRWWLQRVINQEELDSMLKTLTRYKETDQWKKDAGKFIPHPYTWLNQGRWEDDVEGPGTKTTFKSYGR